MSDRPALELLLKTLRLPSIAACYADVAVTAEKNAWSFGQYLHGLADLEVNDRRLRRIERNLKRSGLAADKTLQTLQTDRLPVKVRRVLPTLCEGGFLERAENVLAFGNPGTGKSHVVSAIGHELIQKGYQVLFVPAYRLVQQLLAAKRELVLERILRRLDAFDAVILDDIGYVQQDREEMEVLFTFLAERYERRSVMITSNLVFSQWDKIFKDAMTTAAAIDRLVHHSTILELVGQSYRTDGAKRGKQRNRAQAEKKGSAVKK